MCIMYKIHVLYVHIAQIYLIHLTVYYVHNDSLLAIALSGIDIVNNDKKRSSRPFKLYVLIILSPDYYCVVVVF